LHLTTEKQLQPKIFHHLRLKGIAANMICDRSRMNCISNDQVRIDLGKCYMLCECQAKEMQQAQY